MLPVTTGIAVVIFSIGVAAAGRGAAGVEAWEQELPWGHTWAALQLFQPARRLTLRPAAGTAAPKGRRQGIGGGLSIAEVPGPCCRTLGVPEVRMHPQGRNGSHACPPSSSSSPPHSCSNVLQVSYSPAPPSLLLLLSCPPPLCFPTIFCLCLFSSMSDFPPPTPLDPPPPPPACPGSSPSP